MSKAADVVIGQWPVFALGAIVGFSVGYSYWRVRAAIASKQQQENEQERCVEATEDGGEHTHRMIIGVRSDLKMGKGKVAAQVAHAAVAAYVKAATRTPRMLQNWTRHGQAKITVRLDGEAEMLQLAEDARRRGILVSIIRDAGHTQVAPETRTVIAFGPAPKHVLDDVTGHLKLY